MPVPLPNNYTIISASGSQWTAVVTVQNDDGTLANLLGKSFEFVVRSSVTMNVAIPGAIGAAIFSVTDSASTANGTIMVNTTLSQVSVIVTATAANLLTQGGGAYTLWMDPGSADATALLTGLFLTQTVPAP